MHTDFDINDTAWEKLISDTAYYFDDLTLKRGFQYYKQNRVQSFSLTTSRIIQALVEDQEPYSVFLSLDNLPESVCACPLDAPCRHMAAVMMLYADKLGRSVPMLANAKAAALRPKTEVNPKAALTGVSTSRREQVNKLAGLIPDADIAEWHEYMALLTAPLAHTVRNPQYADRALAAIAEARPKLSPASALLYKLHSHLFILESLRSPAGLSVPGAVSSLGYYTSIAVSELQNAITRLVKQTLPLEAEPEALPRVRDTLAWIRRRMLIESRDRSRDQPYYSVCYELLWQRWIVPNASGPAQYTEELEQLRQTADELGASSSRPALLLAESRMYFLLNDDKAAWERLTEASERPGLHPEELMSFLKTLAEEEHWSRLTAWLPEIGPLLTSRLYNLQDYAGYWDEAVRRLPEAEAQMWDTLSGMLPLSREIYDEKLLVYGRYEDWMDYQLSSGKEPSDFRVRDLQPVEKHAPELLLPFYHQAAERYVLEKNRHSYKAAVKLLKRLSKLYKKLKREERWEAYLEAFAGRHSRLRALQEELKKGNLLP